MPPDPAQFTDKAEFGNGEQAVTTSGMTDTDAVPNGADRAGACVPPPPTRTPELVARVAAQIGAIQDFNDSGRDDPPSIEGYELLSRLGRGGMGVVYRAYQLNPPRTVAIKLLRRGVRASIEELGRFRNEIEAIAGLQHPNIVPIYEVGNQEGLSYFSMEHVEGGALGDDLTKRPQSPRTAAEFIRVCAKAIQWAHEHGIVHRDLKPANILLVPSGAEDGVLLDTCDGARRFIPKISDFGLAKRFDTRIGSAPIQVEEQREQPVGEDPCSHGPWTAYGKIVGTPSYMAPEQIDGHAGRAVDIYALCAILYELLTGTPPFRGVTHADTLNQVQHVEPVRPGTLQPGIPRDLETICLKGLAKLPAQRYASASALADDLSRFLANQPISARPTPYWDRGLKWIRRNPMATVVSTVSLLSALVIAGGGWWTSAKLADLAERLRSAAQQSNQQAQAAQDERDEARRHERVANELRAEAEAQRKRAEANLEQARRIVDDLVTRLSEDPRLRAHNLDDLRRELLQSALGHYEEFIRNNEDNPLVRGNLGQAYGRLASITSQLGDKNEATELYRKAISVFSELVKQHDDPGFLYELAKCHRGLGGIFISTARSLARDELQRAQAIQQRLVREHPDNTDYQRALADSTCALGMAYRDVYLNTSLFEKAGLELERALDIQVKLAAQLPARDELQVELSRTYRNYAWYLRLIGRFDESKRANEAAFGLAKMLCAASPGLPTYVRELGFCHWEFGNLEYDQDHFPAAERAYLAAATIQEKLQSQHPEVPAYQIDLGLTYHYQSLCQLNVGNVEGSLPFSNLALECMQSAREIEPENIRAAKLASGVLLIRSEIFDRLGRAADSQQDRDLALALEPLRSWITEAGRAEKLARRGDHVYANHLAQRISEWSEVPADLLAQLVYVYAQCAVAVGQDDELPAKERGDQSKQYIKRAVELARRAHVAGAYQTATALDELKSHADLEVLRTNHDFLELLSDLSKTQDNRDVPARHQ